MDQPKVSVIIPVYNTEKYLRECLDSVVNQTLRRKKENKMNNSTIHIAFICDENYVLCTGVAIHSLLMHRAKERNYLIYVICDKVSEESRALLRADTTEGFEICCIDSQKIPQIIKLTKVKNAPHVTTAAINKFFLASLLPAVDKLLYLDGDILVRDNLAGLYDTELKGAYAAVCKDLGAELWPAHYNERLHAKLPYYFNSGVMLLNLEAIRSDNMEKKLLEYRIKGINNFMDQDAFNMIFGEKTCLLDARYNMATSCWTLFPVEELNQKLGTDFSGKGECYRQAKILHLTTGFKPWKYSDVIGSEEWFAYYLDSPLVSKSLNRQLFGNSVYMQKIENECNYRQLAEEATPTLSVLEEKPVISVVTPVYNSQAHLAECVESLLTQSLRTLEFIFVDDGSTDDSRELLSVYQHIDPRVRVMLRDHRGAGPARNDGIEAAQGKYIVFQDSDDIMEPSALAKLYEHAEQLAADITLCGSSTFFADKNQSKKNIYNLNTAYMPGFEPFSAQSSSKTLFQITTYVPWSKLFRREYLQKHNLRFPATPRSEDIPFTGLSLAFAERIAYVDETLIHHRIDRNSNSLEETKDRFPLAAFEGYELIWKKLEEVGLLELLRQSLLNSYCSSWVYHFDTFKTVEGFHAFYDAFRTIAIPNFGVDFSDSKYFYSERQYRMLKEIAESESCESYLFKRLKAETNKKSDKVARLQYGLEAPKGSNNRAQLFLAVDRKVRSGIQCYWDHGAGYTFRRTLYHIGLWEDEEAPRGPENRPKLVKHAERILHKKKGK